MPGRSTLYAQLWWRTFDGPVWTLLTALVVTLVLVGGAIPAAYGYGLPHDHIYLGGSLTIGSELHHHDNPLAVVLGPIATTTDDEEAAPAEALPTGPPPTADHVLSVYSGGLSTILSTIGVAILPAYVDRLDRRQSSVSVSPPTIGLTPLADDGPVPPPPRPLLPRRS